MAEPRAKPRLCGSSVSLLSALWGKEGGKQGTGTNLAWNSREGFPEEVAPPRSLMKEQEEITKL